MECNWKLEMFQEIKNLEKKKEREERNEKRETTFQILDIGYEKDFGRTLNVQMINERTLVEYVIL